MSDAIVYIVDDNASACRAVYRRMHAAGLDAMPFTSAQAFLDHRRADKPGCLILDLRMPGLSGLDLQTRLGEVQETLPIVFVTGHGNVPTSVRAMKGGAVDLPRLFITEQQGNTFVGRLKRANPTGDEDEPLWGAFTPDGQLMMGSDEEGFYIFRLIDENTLDYCYSESGPSARSVCARLARQR